MAVQTQRMTVDEFERYVELPENADRLFEYIGREVVEVPPNAYASKIASRINGFIFMYLLQHDIGHLTGEAGGYKVAGEDYAPDVAFISRQKQPELAQQGYNPNPPDLAVEIDFPSTYQSQKNLKIKIVNYLYAGATVWVVNPDQRSMEVYAPDQPAKIIDADGTLDGGDVLPDFRLAVKDIFPE